MKKILLAIQFWKGDKNQACRLAEFLADLESKRCEIADFLFVARFDCPQSLETIKQVSRKFNVFTYTSRRRGTGWPMGCNELWLATMEWAHNMKGAGKIPDYSAMFTFEADMVPLYKNWISHLQLSWEREHVRRNGQLTVMGAWLPNGMTPGLGHINGNCLCSLDPAISHEMIRIINRCPVIAGWDYFAGMEFKKIGWAELPGMVSEWRTVNFTDERWHQLVSSGIKLHHGCKDASLLNLSRKNLL